MAAFPAAAAACRAIRGAVCPSLPSQQWQHRLLRGAARAAAPAPPPSRRPGASIGQPRPLSVQARAPAATAAGGAATAGFACQKVLPPGAAGATTGTRGSRWMSAAAATPQEQEAEAEAAGKKRERKTSVVKARSLTKPKAPNKAGAKKSADNPTPRQPRGEGMSAGEPEAPQVAPIDKALRCTAFCTAESYDAAKLLAHLSRHYSVQPFINDEVCHVRVPRERDEGGGEGENGGAGPAGDVFVFKSGTIVTWGTTNAENDKLLRLLNEVPGVEIEPLAQHEKEDCDYRHDMSLSNKKGGISSAAGLTRLGARGGSIYDFRFRPTALRNDTIVLGNTVDLTWAMLSFSHGLARSAKLSVLETALDRYLADNRHLSGILMEGRKLPLTRADVLCKLGALLNFRQQLNLNHTECFLDTPDFYWSQPRLEECYDAVSKAFDVHTRIATLNRKLDYANELAQTLRDHLTDM
ncbi:MAG: hypothetical protein BJ554DRAFT_6072, partial [Olpidium bornovanus]